MSHSQIILNSSDGPWTKVVSPNNPSGGSYQSRTGKVVKIDPPQAGLKWMARIDHIADPNKIVLHQEPINTPDTETRTQTPQTVYMPSTVYHVPMTQSYAVVYPSGTIAPMGFAMQPSGLYAPRKWYRDAYGNAVFP
jgi:hypothetical protein